MKNDASGQRRVDDNYGNTDVMRIDRQFTHSRVNREGQGHIRVKQNVFLPQVKNDCSQLKTHSSAEDFRLLGENEVE